MFFAVSVLIVVGIYILTRRRMGILWRVFGVTLLLVLFALFLSVLDIPTRAEAKWYETPPFKHGIALGFMLLGMAGKYLFDAIQVRRKKRAEGDANPKLQLDRWEFFQPFIIAFIIFGSFWQIHGDESLSMTWLILSFQNGFFWQTILAKPG